MIVAGFGVGVALLTIALIGAAAPVLHRAPVVVEEYPSPLRDRRRHLLLEIDDLDAARAERSLSTAAYADARAGVERRLAAVDARLHGERPTEASPAGPPRSAPGRATTAALVVVLVAVVAVPTMLSASAARAPGQPITGTLPSLSVPSPGTQTLASLRAQVRATPGDIGARLTLARAEFDRGQLGDASTQYLAVLKLDPTNAEATARLGLILGLSGRAKEGVAAIDHALRLDATYTEALLFRAILELRVLDEPASAVRDARAYLASPAATTDPAETRSAQRLIADARAELPVSTSGGAGT